MGPAGEETWSSSSGDCELELENCLTDFHGIAASMGLEWKDGATLAPQNKITFTD